MAEMKTQPPARLLARRLAYEGWSRLYSLDVEIEVGGQPQIVQLEVKDHGDGAAALPFDPALRVGVFVQQARGGALLRGHAEPLLEAPAGLIDPGDADPAATVRRELCEEAGINHPKLAPVAALYSSPGSLAERVHLFLAEIDVTAEPELGRGTATATEGVTVLVLPLATAWELWENGDIPDMKTGVLLQALRLRRPALFG